MAKRKVVFDPITQRPKPRGGKRSGAGRPKTMQDAVYIGVRLDRPDYERMVAVAAELKLTVGETARKGLLSWLTRRESLVVTKRGRRDKS